MAADQHRPSDSALEYVAKEAELCESLVADMKPSLSKQDKLRILYGVREGQEAVYCESGTIEENLITLGLDKTLVVPVFPYPKESGLKTNVAGMDVLLAEALETRRILPVIQHPGYYSDIQHFEPLLREVAPPSYFVRGQYAYAIAFDKPIDMVKGRLGNPLLREIHELMQWAQEHHSESIEVALRDETCWEHRWKDQQRRDDPFYDRLRQSFRYRYASVAFSISKTAADAIIEHYGNAVAWRILLHLHILFDHVISHGFGSDYAVAPVTAEGLDFGKARLELPTEYRRAVEPLSVTLPSRLDTEVEQVLEEHHFLRPFNLDKVSPDAIRDLRYELDQRIKEFEKQMERLSSRKQTVSKTFEISFMAAGALNALGGAEIPGVTLIVVGADKISGVPRLISEQIFKGLAKSYRQELRTYLISAAQRC